MGAVTAVVALCAFFLAVALALAAWTEWQMLKWERHVESALRLPEPVPVEDSEEWRQEWNP